MQDSSTLDSCTSHPRACAVCTSLYEAISPSEATSATYASKHFALSCDSKVTIHDGVSDGSQLSESDASSVEEKSFGCCTSAVAAGVYAVRNDGVGSTLGIAVEDVEEGPSGNEYAMCGCALGNACGGGAHDAGGGVYTECIAGCT